MGKIPLHKKSRIFGLMLIVIMMLSSINSVYLDQVGEVSHADARQSLEVDCSNYSFEELFVYDYASYNLVVGDDWKSGWMTASAYVNGSNAAEVREDLDGLLDGAPGGNNSWISTDEREAVRQVGPDCIGDMETKVGLREGMSHRGGVDWNDLEWVADGIALDEKDLVPAGHSQERSCQGAWASTDCKEVPVSITDNLEIHLIADTENSHENVQFNKLPNNGNANFTFAMNTTNVTTATLTAIFPAVDGLRVVGWDLLRDGVSHKENVSNEPTQSINGDGSLVVIWEASYDLADWPVIQELYVDFTTQPVETNDPPEWSIDSPMNDTIIPILKDGTETVLLTSEQISEFLVDEGDVQMTCTGPSSWSFQTSSDGDLMVTPGDGTSVSISCNGVDQNMLTSDEERTWTVTQPATFDGIINSDTQALITVTTSLDNPSVWLTGVQGARDTTEEGAQNFNDQTQIILDLNPLLPGSFLIEVTFTAGGAASSIEMLDWVTVIDLGLSKISNPPSVTVQKTIDGDNGSWDSSGYSYYMSGTFYEPDGETVDFTIEVCGFTTTSVNQMGANWDATVSVAGCTSHDSYTITVTVTDASGTQSETVVVASSPGGDVDADDGGGGAITSDDGGGIPAPGIAFAIIGLALAALARRRD